MASLGPTFVGAGTDQGTNWTGTGNVTAEDGVTATLSALPANNGEVLRCTMAANAFSVPAGSNIAGILIEVKADYTDAFGGTVTYTKVQLVNGGVNIGTNQAAGGPSSGALAYNSFGGANNTCGAALTVAIVNSTTFGVDISFSDNGSGPGQVDVDAVRLTVFYSPAPLVDEMVAALTSMQPVPAAFFVRNRARPQVFVPIMGFPDPTSFTLPNAPEPIHPENYPMEFNPRAPQPERRAYQQILMGEYDPTMFLLGNEPEPLHPENYPPAALLPNPRPGRQAWQFPIMASTDYTSLLSGEAAHPETTRQACADLPRRDWPRQYQPPMERIDPAALALGAQSTAQVPPSMGQPPFRARTVQPPAVEATSYVWATPGDPALLVAAMQPIGNQNPRLAQRPIVGETLLLDGWSAQQLPHGMQDRPHARHRPIPLQSEGASIAPQHFQDAQVIAWMPPLPLPQSPRRLLARSDEQGELGGETIDPSAILEFAPMQALPVARTIVRPSGGESMAIIASPAGLSGLFFEPLEQFTHRRPHAPARIESATVLADLWTSDRQLPDQPSNYRRQIALPYQPAAPGAETVQQPVLPTYQILDYDPRGQQP
ncbi:MAG: hypothetical protein KGL35_00435, partial [Bradyrhizobium sp.]|nr:hypothetical protein [Bradyrhizobium sp.]